MPYLADLFDAARGDLIYGLESERSTALLSDQRLVDASNSDAWFMINSFNNGTILRNEVAKYYAVPTDKTPTGKQKSEIMKGVKDDKKVQAAAFVDGLYQRYPPNSIAKIPVNKLVGEGRGGETALRRNKMIRSSCKFGIENLILNTPRGSFIHFLLGGLDPVAAANRVEYDDKVPITFSEIRSVFRNWAAYQTRVKFYDGAFLETNQAPWDTNPQEWRDYAIRRLDKIVKQAEKAKLNTATKRLADAQRLLIAVRKPTDRTALMTIVDTATNLREKSVTFTD